MVYQNRQTKFSGFTKSTAASLTDKLVGLQNGLNTEFDVQEIIDLVANVYGASLRTFEFESELVASDIQLDEYAIVEENNYAFYKVTNDVATAPNVALTSGLTATHEVTLKTSVSSYDDLRTALSAAQYAPGDTVTLASTSTPGINGDGVVVDNSIIALTGNGGSIITSGGLAWLRNGWQGRQNVQWYGAVADWDGTITTISTQAFTDCINTGLDVYVPANTDPSLWYYIDGALPELSRWQSMRGDGYTQIKVDTTSTDYRAFTISTDNIFEGLYVEGTGTTNGTGLAISAGSLSTDFASTCTIKNCWFRLLKTGLEFDNAFTCDIRATQFRQCATGTTLSPTITDIPTEQYLANITFDSACRWNGNTINDVVIDVSDNARCRGVNFFGCAFDPMGAGATESIILNKAALVAFKGCYLEADTSATVKQILATNSVFVSIEDCVMTGTGGIDLTASQMSIKNVWSFSAVAGDAEDPIIADSSSTVSIEQSTLRSTAHNFLNAARVTLIDATIRVSGTVTYFKFSQYKNWTPSADEGVFTPSYDPASGAFTSVTYDTSNTKGYYIKDGNKVFVSGVIRTSAITVGTASGDVYINLNIPWAPANQAYRSSINLSEVGVSGAFNVNHPTEGGMVAGSTNCKLFYRTSANGADTPLQVSDLTTASTGNFTQFSGTIILDAP